MREMRVTYMPFRERHRHERRPWAQGVDDFAKMARAAIGDEVVEVFVALLFDTNRRLLGFTEVGRGTLDSVFARPRDVFRAAVLANAGSIVVAHNHPSGDPSPSPDDISLTKRLFEAGELMCIPLRDHIILGADRHYSLVLGGFIPKMR